MAMAQRKFCTGILLFILTALWISILRVDASIHEYRMESFSQKSNAYFFHGGSEGLYASKPHQTSSSSSAEKGESFIRYFLLFSLLCFKSLSCVWVFVFIIWVLVFSYVALY